MNPSVRALIDQTFGHLEQSKRMSIINLFFFLSGVDGNRSETKLNYISDFCDALNVDAESSVYQYQSGGYPQLKSHLSILSNAQKELLVFSVFDLLGCDGKPTEKELNTMVQIFDQVGVDEDEIVAIMDKGISLNRKFNF